MRNISLISISCTLLGLAGCARLPMDGGGDCQWRLSNVTFSVRYANPPLHSGFLVASVQPEMKQAGNHTVVTYPDGSLVADGQTKPSFQKASGHSPTSGTRLMKIIFLIVGRRRVVSNKKPINLLYLFIALASVAGCVKDYSLSPPADSEVITVTVNVPEHLEAEKIQVMYRSAVCKSPRRNHNGERYEVEGHHGVDVHLKREGQTSLYSARLPVDGGGQCQWRLSNVIFGVQYLEPARFGDGVSYDGGGGIVVMFDGKRAPIGSAFPINIKGDLKVKKDYYPWVSERFIGGHVKSARLVGEAGIYVFYRAETARSVYFEPVLHADFVVHSVWPKVKKEGNYPVYTYPDGQVITEGVANPSFKRLEAIRHSKESGL